jgi:DmsE family decaheme c-type cytochrome
LTHLHDRTIPWSTAVRALALLAVAAFVGFYLAFMRPALTPPAHAQATERAAQPTIVGRDCKRCHTQQVEDFTFNIHGKSAKFLKDERAADCVTCHQNAEKHVETATRTQRGEDPWNPAKQPSGQANATCLKCHSGDQHTFAWQGSEHDRKDMSCLSCHSVHHAKSPERLLANFTVEETCLSCHKEQRKALFQRSTHLFRTEQRNMKVGCTSCHNPHGGEGRKMLLSHTVNNLCYNCHAEKRGPFLWEHPPAREDCMVCHSPHGANNPKLLIARGHLMCQQCHIHMLPRHSTTAGRPLDIWSINRGCVNCHSQVHGSNHPGGRTFGR